MHGPRNFEKLPLLLKNLFIFIPYVIFGKLMRSPKKYHPPPPQAVVQLFKDIDVGVRIYEFEFPSVAKKYFSFFQLVALLLKNLLV